MRVVGLLLLLLAGETKKQTTENAQLRKKKKSPLKGVVKRRTKEIKKTKTKKVATRTALNLGEKSPK